MVEPVFGQIKQAHADSGSFSCGGWRSTREWALILHDSQIFEFHKICYE